MQNEEPKRCKICGARLHWKYRHTGRCRRHQFVKGEDVQLTDDAKAAKELGMKYGEYIAAKREGRV